jgi:hypothetical protein
MPKAAKQVELKTPADERWGYPFGVDGLMGTDEACRFLGGCHRHTLDNIASEGNIRKGKSGNRIVICRRSIEDYVSSIEV